MPDKLEFKIKCHPLILHVKKYQCPTTVHMSINFLLHKYESLQCSHGMLCMNRLSPAMMVLLSQAQTMPEGVSPGANILTWVAKPEG